MSTDTSEAVTTNDALSELPAEIAALIERYGSARQEIAATLLLKPHHWELVARAERRLVDALKARGVIR